MSVTAYPTLRLKLTVPQALKVRFLPAIPGTNAGNAAAAAEVAAAQAIAAAEAATAATASKVDKAGDSMSGLLTLSSDPVANLHAATKQYVDASVSSTVGDVTTSGPVVATQLAGYADTTGNVIQGVNVGAGLDMSAGTTLNLDDDLSAIAALTGVNTIYYRSSPGVWTAVAIGSNLTFTGGILAAPGAGNVASTGTPTNGQFARWTDAITIEGISPATALTALGAQPLDGDLTALAALSGTNTIYYRSAADTWSPVLIGANMTFTGGTLSASGGGGGGGVAAVGVPTTGQLARWTTGTTIEGIDTSTLGLAPLASPTFTGDARSVTPATGDNDTSIATTAYVQANLAFFAPLASPVLTGDPQAPTPATGDNDTSIATTAFVKAQAYAPLASPALTGNPTAPTATAGDNDTSIATTAFVTAATATRIKSVAFRVFPSSGTYTPTAGMLFAIMECVGGGGGGGPGGASVGYTSGGGGGGGGGYAKALKTAAQVGASQAVTIGAGGISGTAGGTTSVGTLCSANGGIGGGAGTNAAVGIGGSGGSGVGDLVIPGEQGGHSAYSSGANIVSYNIPLACGGSSHFGAGASPTYPSSGTDTVGYSATTGFGGGGGGEASLNGSGGLFSGGAGRLGVVVITEFCA